jgi:acetyltransferase
LTAIPERVDLAIIIVNARLVLAVLDECAQLGIPAAVIMATGFAEAGGDGATAAQRIGEIANAHQIRLCGPGSFGLIAVRERVSAYMSPLRGELKPGPIAVVTQSGSLVNVIVTLGQERQLGFSYLASAGSEAGLIASDYFLFFVEDERTRVIAAVVEQFRDPEALVRVAERAAELGKPLVVLKLGRSEAARRASIAHTGALAGSAEFHDAVFRRYGISAVANLDEFMETASLLAKARLPRGPRVGVVSVSGGDCVLATDVAARVGVQLPQFSEQTQQSIRALVPEAGLSSNPFDVGMRPLWESGLFGKALELVASDPNVDLVAARLNPAIGLFREMGPVAANHDVPVLTFTRATQTLSPEQYNVSEEIGVPILQEVERSLKAIKHLVDYAAFQRGRKSRGKTSRRSAPPSEEIENTLSGDRRVLTETDSKRVLAWYGIPVTRERLVQSADEAVSAATGLGYPVAMKLMSPEIVHKTEAGAIRVGVGSQAEIRSTYAELLAAGRQVPGAQIDGVLVQEMAPPGIELMLGMIHDDQLGPGIVFGLGGFSWKSSRRRLCEFRRWTPRRRPA